MKHLTKLFLGILIIALASAWSQPPNKPTSKEVLEDFFNASGGVEKWKNMKTLQVGGSYEEDGESATFYSHYSHIDARMRYESDEGFITIVSLSEEWVKVSGKDWQDWGKIVKVTNRSFYNALLMNLKNAVHSMAFLIRIYSDRPQVLELAENPIADNNDIALILVPDEEMDKHKKQKRTYYFLFDPSTKLLNKTVQVDDVGDITKIINHSDYREVDGFTISHGQEVIAMKTTHASLGLSGTLKGATTTYTYTSFKFNEEIDPKVFVAE